MDLAVKYKRVPGVQIRKFPVPPSRIPTYGGSLFAAGIVGIVRSKGIHHLIRVSRPQSSGNQEQCGQLVTAPPRIRLTNTQPRNAVLHSSTSLKRRPRRLIYRVVSRRAHIEGRCAIAHHQRNPRMVNTAVVVESVEP